MINIHEFSDDILGKLHVHVYLPPEFNKKNQPYSVLYMHDGQNLFFDQDATYGHSWRVHESIEALNLQYLIVVAIDSNHHRLDFYSPYPNHSDYDRYFKKKCGGLGAVYSNFIVKVLKPFIDHTYPTNPDKAHTYVAGSSMGAYISLYQIAKYPHIFSVCGLFSTALWFNDEALINDVLSSNLNHEHHAFLCVGTIEVSDDESNPKNLTYVTDTQRLEKILKQKSVDTLSIIEKEKHHELAWRNQFKHFLKLLIALGLK